MKRKNKIKRTNCRCEKCRAGCEILSGYLLPDDLQKYRAATAVDGQTVWQWAEKNLLASQGATVARQGPRGVEFVRIPTLVPATRDNGHCVHYRGGLCNVHQASPAGCAMFNACAIGAKAAKQDALANELQRRLAAFWDADAIPPAKSLYKAIWWHLWDTGHRRENVAELAEEYRAGVI